MTGDAVDSSLNELLEESDSHWKRKENALLYLHSSDNPSEELKDFYENCLERGNNLLEYGERIAEITSQRTGKPGIGQGTGIAEDTAQLVHQARSGAESAAYNVLEIASIFENADEGRRIESIVDDVDGIPSGEYGFIDDLHEMNHGRYTRKAEQVIHRSTDLHEYVKRHMIQ